MIELPFTPPQASTTAPQVDLLTAGLIGLSGLFTSVVVLLIIYFSIRYRRGNDVDRSQPPITSIRVELSWVLLIFILGMGSYAAASLVYLQMFRVPENALEIYVLGRQWMWEIQHPDGPREINELHVPVGVPVRLIMTSQDVIHSFYVPAFRQKYDAIPGRYTGFSFEATQAGEYHLFCAEYCGTGHASMIGSVIVMERRDYQDWLAANGSAGGDGAATVSMAESGRQVYEQMGCSSCHDPDSTVEAPGLAGRFGERARLQDGATTTFDENYVRESILLPQRKIADGYDPIMPTYQDQITEEEIQQLLVYLKSRDGGGSPEKAAGNEGRQMGEINDGTERMQP